MKKTLFDFYLLDDKKTKDIVELGIKQSLKVNIFNDINLNLQFVKKNEKSVKEQINLEKKRIVNLGKGKHINFNSNKEIKYTKKFPDNKSAFYYPLKKNFMSDEEEKKYNHYYGEEFIDRVSRIDRTNKKETYLQDDIISNFIFLYLVTHKSNEKELIAKIKSTFRVIV